MKMYSWISITIIILLAVFAVGVRDDGTYTLHELHEKMIPIENTTIELVNSFEYKNPYQENFTLQDFIMNTVHVIVYPIIKEVHTVAGGTINLSWQLINKENLFKLFKWGAFFLIMTIILRSIKPIGITYVIIGEYFKEKKIKLHWSLQLGISIIIILLLALIVMGLILWIF